MSNLKQLVKSCIPRQIIEYAGSNDGLLLTFDDGPDEHLTPRILDLLKEYDTRAVFFILGCKVASNAEILERMVVEGHCLGNHTYSHKIVGEIDYKGYVSEIRRCQSMIEPYIDGKPTLFRPPQGKLSLAAWYAIKREGLRAMLWSAESGEWGANAHESAEAMFARLNTTLAKQDILLMHDNNEKVVSFLELLLPALKKRGMAFVEPLMEYPYH